MRKPWKFVVTLIAVLAFYLWYAGRKGRYARIY